MHKIMAEHIFKAKGFLEKSYLDKDGAKHATFEFSVKDALELAKLELMGRELLSFRPVLLDIKIKVSDEQPKKIKSEPKIQRRKYKG
jgi:hypothetical protein